MKKIVHFLLAAAVLCLAASCSEKDDPEKPNGNAPAAPTGVKLNRYTDSSLIFQWSLVSGAESYDWQLLQDGSSVRTGNTKSTNVIIEGLTKGVLYTFQVRSVAGNAASAWSAAVDGVPGGEVENGGENNNGGGDPSGGEDPSVTPGEPVTDAVYAQFAIPAHEEDNVVRAFPGAEGGGMYTTGGRGGKVIHVTSLADNGQEGTLRYAVNQSGPRTVVFDVAGIITLASDLKVTKGDLTIAGQTAPGDGICIRGGTVNIQASNIIIRYVRFRLGDESTFLSDGSDCIWGRYNENIIIDHCSMSWSVDEVASFYANRNFTMQWCILAESMTNSVHGKGSHGYGGIWGGKNASFHHNLLAHNKSRNARIDHPEIYGNYLTTHRGNVDYRNNVIYNWGDNSTYGGEDGYFNLVGNYYKPGPASKDRKYFLDANGFYSSSGTQYRYPRVYLEDNVHTKYPEFTGDQTKGVYLHDGSDKGEASTMFLGAALSIKADDAKVCYTTTHSAEKAMEQVTAYAGASLKRDDVDEHVVNDTRSGGATYSKGSNGSTGGLIDSQKDVGGWPVYAATDAELDRIKDSDGDGIPDWFEAQFGLDANKNDANSIYLDKNGRYTNLEMYLHYLVKDIVNGGNTQATYTNQ